MKVFIGILGLTCLVAIGGVWHVTQPVGALAGGQFGAEITCEKYVKDSLRSPASAKFSSSSETRTTNIYGGTWTVRGWVDADNGFGAQTRREYDCQVSATGTNTWRRDSLTITPR